MSNKGENMDYSRTLYVIDEAEGEDKTVLTFIDTWADRTISITSPFSNGIYGLINWPERKIEEADQPLIVETK